MSIVRFLLLRFTVQEVKLSLISLVKFKKKETVRVCVPFFRRATLEKVGRFTKQDIRELCPSLSISSIEGALRKLVASGELKREGSGKNICYYRLK